MVPSFNTAGPCVPGEHYMLPPAQRLSHVMRLIDERKFFLLHAGHQTGKTTCARWLVKHYNASGRCSCTWIDIQTAGENPDPARAFRTVLNNMRADLARDLPHLPPPDVEALLRDPETAILSYLRTLSAASTRPLVVLIDEADGLVGATMVSFLRQLRQGYIDRSDVPFPDSLALIGRRQVRDYALSQTDRRDVAWLGTTSPFNITAESPTLSLFSEADVTALLMQHTQHTGQRFLADAARAICHLSQGHPWLVNALADQVVNRDVEDRQVDITAAHVEAAKETLILERRTHIDSLIARLREDRVRRIIEPMLIGGEVDDSDSLNDDFSYVVDLGILALRNGEYQIANPIYREVIPRALTFDRQAQLHLKPAAYVRPDGSLDMHRLMLDWQEFWREDGHLGAHGFKYREAGPHLMLMAFLQRIVNGGGRIQREYGLGRRALDLLISFGGRRYPIEVKLRRGERTRELGLNQLGQYLDGLGLSEGWLVIFDRRRKVPWEEKLSNETISTGKKQVHVVGC